MMPQKGGYVPGASSGQELVEAVPKLKDVAEIQVEQVAAINSADMTPELWIDLASRVQSLLADLEIVGAVVTHGTNTLEETAYFLDLVVSGSKPIVIVGAQRPASDPYSDGPLNLL